jgi:hypothetical protein
MKKLSGILPSNSRLSAVDMARSQPVRSGTPSFGRSVIEAASTKPLPKTVLSEASFTYEQMRGVKEQDKIQQGIIDNMDKQFFDAKIEEINTPVVPTDGTHLVGENLNVVA